MANKKVSAVNCWQIGLTSFQVTCLHENIIIPHGDNSNEINCGKLQNYIKENLQQYNHTAASKKMWEHILNVVSGYKKHLLIFGLHPDFNSWWD